MIIKNYGKVPDILIETTSTFCRSKWLQDMSDGTSYYPFNINIPAEGSTALVFHGLRLVCSDVSDGVGIGSSIPVKLVFEKFGLEYIMIGIQNPP